VLLMGSEEGEEGVVTVDLVAAVRLVVVREENLTDLVGCDLVEFIALTRLYPVKALVEEVSILKVEVRGAQRVEGMLNGDRCDENETWSCG
jgi:hypothetical protein